MSISSTLRLGRRRTLSRAAVAAVALALLAACSSSASSDSSSAKASASGSVPAGTVLNFGDQAQLIKTLFSASGEDKDLPYTINWVQFQGGPLVDAGFAAQRIDAGFLGDLPAALAVQSGLKVKAIATNISVGPFEYLAAQPGITSLKQLKGKKVAYPTGTSEHAFALRALAGVGLSEKDVEHVDSQQAYQALESGKVAAAVLDGPAQVNPYLKGHSGAKVLATNESVKPASYTYELATTAALADPAKSAAIWDFVQRLIKASDWAYNHESEFAQKYLVDVQHETPAQAKLGISAGIISNFVPIDGDVSSALQNVVDLLQGTSVIKSKFDVSPLFDSAVTAKFNALVAKTPQSASTTAP